MPLPPKFDPLPLVAWVSEYGTIPDDYVALDIESSGIDIHRDLPLQIGWCVVKNRKAVFEADVLIDWSQTLPSYQLDELKTRMEATRVRMAEKSKAYPWTMEMLRARGLHPDVAISRLVNTLGQDISVAAHYGWSFDYPVLGRTFDLVGRSFSPEPERMFDTGLMLKACLTGVTPSRHESIVTYVKRLHAARCKAGTKLELAAELFDLRTGTGVQARHVHFASYDSWLVHLLLEQIRGLAVKTYAGGVGRG